VVKSRRPGTVVDFASETRFEVPPVVFEQKITSAICVPMFAGGELFGVLIGHTHARREFTDNEIDLYQSFANQAAVAIKNAEYAEEAKQSEARYETIFNATSEAIFIHDAATGAVLDVNRAMLEMYGVSREEALRSQAHDLSAGDPPYSGKEAVAWIARAREEGPQTFEWLARRKGGELFWVEASLSFITVNDNPRVIAVVRDIDERKKAAAALEKSRAEFEAIFRAISDAVVFVDPERRIMMINPAFTATFGYLPGEAAGRTTAFIYADPGDYQRQGKARYSPRADGAEPVYEMEYRRKDGATFIAETLGAKVESGGKLLGYIGVIRDISERRRMEEQMRQVQKLESLGVLAGGIAHDFNNLLMAILGNADLALSELFPMSPARENLKAIETVSRRAADLCRQMLAYSGKGKFVIEKIDANDLIGEMIHMLEVSISKKVVMKLNLADNLPMIEGDPGQVRQVLMNLVINGSEAIGERSGVISISTGAMGCDHAYLADTFRDSELVPGTYVFIEVADTGCGMDEETRARIFDPFFTTKFTGRGLGMAAVLGIVRGHQGAIRVYSEEGRGTTFKILFPAARVIREEAVGNIPLPAKAGGDGRGQLVLLVDDEPTVLAVGGKMLEKLGYKVVCAKDGAEGLKIFAERCEEIWCVVMDLTMPRMDGEEAFREMRRIKKEVRVILASGYNEQEVSQRFVGKGVAGFLQKPFRMQDLQEALAKILDP